jgi:hypothetical protein
VYGFGVLGVAEGHCAGDEGAPVASLDDYINSCVLVARFWGGCGEGQKDELYSVYPNLVIRACMDSAYWARPKPFCEM